MASFGLKGKPFSRVISIFTWSRSKKLNFRYIAFQRWAWLWNTSSTFESVRIT